MTISRQLINFRGTLAGWLQAARNNVESNSRTRRLPAGVALAVVSFDLFLSALCFLYTRELSVVGWAIASIGFYLVRLFIVMATLVLACRHYRVSAQALGIRPSNLFPDFRWSFRICLAGAAIMLLVILAGFIAARALGIRLPAPPALFVQILSGSFPAGQFVVVAGVAGIVLMLLAPLTEELVYRAVFVPVLAHRFGLIPSLAVTAAVFGFAHVVGAGRLWIPLPEIVGGLLMAAAFLIRWSVVPAIVIHAMGNLVSSVLILLYVQLFKACPSWFVNP